MRNNLVYLHHILDEALYLASVQKKISREEFLSDETYQRAVVRSIEIIGEVTPL